MLPSIDLVRPVSPSRPAFKSRNMIGLEQNSDRRRSAVVFLLLGALFAGFAWPCEADDARPRRKKQVDFVRHVQAIFRKHCYTCHGPEVQEGGLRLDARKHAFAGSDNGKIIVPGESDGSLLFHLIAGTDKEGRLMPPKDEGAPLSKEQIAIVRAWIDTGANWPEDAAVSEVEAKHWSFQPVQRPPLPSVENAEWCRSAMDRFILARLESQGLRPAPQTDRHALARRVYLDLIGLPPTPEAVDAFVGDRAADAYERLVDDVLANPHYGERWGRHWLDLVRYADTNGYEGDGEKPLAWKYRDYVIGALNGDKPYDRFVLEQLAGDELADANTESVIATGFIRVGPWDAERGASVQMSEKVAELYNELDDMVSTTSMVFLGLTMGCARCHNHKFDPLTAKDYYSMVAVFHPLKRPHKGRAELATPAVPPRVLKANPETKTPEGYFFRELSPQTPETRLLKRGNPDQPGEVVSPAVPVALVDQPPVFLPPDEFTTRRRLSLARWIVDAENPLTARVIVNRVWQYHFGYGLVRTPSDFGRRSDEPSHPELLDWLADWFIHEGEWSLKKLHRLIMTSSTYRMSKRWDAAAAEKDIDNRLLWHFPYRRLEMEAIRDSMLAVSGWLNPQMYGASMYPQVPAAAKRSAYSPGKLWKPFNEKDASRRTIYAFLMRTFIPPMFDVLDFCDTSRSAERREITTVAPQALTLLNGEFVNRQARHFADRLLREAGSVPENQVELAYRLALGRRPTVDQQREMLSFLKEEAATLLSPAAQPQAARDESLPLDDPALWLDATTGVEIKDDGVVAKWFDQSPSGHHAEPKGGPVFVGDALNGQPAIRFDGKHDWFSLTGQVVTSSQYTIIAVINDRSRVGHRNLIGNWDGSKGNSTTSVFLGTTGSESGRQVRFTDDYANDLGLKNPHEHFVLTAVSEPSNARVFRNTPQIGEKGTAIAARKYDTAWTVGRQGVLDSEYWHGDMAEILVYNAALNENDRARVWRYLGQKYSLSDLESEPKPLSAAEAHRLALVQMCRVIFNLNEFVYAD